MKIRSIFPETGFADYICARHLRGLWARLFGVCTLLLLWISSNCLAATIDIVGPTGSSSFGTSVAVLPDGSFVVTDPNATNVAPNAGAVYLYSPAHALISTLTGSNTNDQVGSGGVVVLANGNFVAVSSNWNNSAMSKSGAVTWVNGNTGLSGAVSVNNSLIGTRVNDQVGYGGVTALSNGDYVVASYYWNNGAATNAGAVTWVNGRAGLSGPVSPSNSLVGTTTDDQVGSADIETGITALSNGNYIVASCFWNNGAATGAGAATWADGSIGLSGAVSSSNSLVGTTANDHVGCRPATALSNGNYVVSSPQWNNGAVYQVGAVTWADGSTGLSGAVSPSNSLIGTSAQDWVGYGAATALTNGNYVVSSHFWTDGALYAFGAVTWANGIAGLSGTVSRSNSLVGTIPGDYVGNAGITALTNGNYVVASGSWNNGVAASAGAATWGNGNTGLTGTVSPNNSLVGTTPNDQVGYAGVTALSNGKYVVNSFYWNNGAAMQAGAVTLSHGGAGIVGSVSPGNSLVGMLQNDRVGDGGVFGQLDGSYIVASPDWNNGAAIGAGAITLASGRFPLAGAVESYNSVRGSAANGGWSMRFSYDMTRQRLIVGRPADNIVTIFTMDQLFTDGFE